MEPTALLTNWLIAVQCLYYFFKLKSIPKKTSSFHSWTSFFFLFGASTFFGGLSHFFFHYLELSGKIPGWSLAVLSITLLELAVFHSSQTQKKYWRIFIWLQTSIIYLLMIWNFKFFWVTIQTVIGLVLVLGIYSTRKVIMGSKEWKGYLIGIGWMIASVPVVIFKFNLSIWFNAHDLSHLFMMLCLYQFYHTTVRLHNPV